MTTICNITWAKIKSANPRSGVMPRNVALFCGLACSRRQTGNIQENVEINPNRRSNTFVFEWRLLTAQNEAADGRNESGQERVERETAHQATIHELNDAGQHDVHQIGIDQLQFLGRVVDVFVVEFVEDHLELSHDDSLLDSFGRVLGRRYMGKFTEFS